MNIKDNDILIRLTHLQFEVYAGIIKKMIFLLKELSLKSKYMYEH